MNIEIKPQKPKSPKFNLFDVVIISVLVLAIIIPIILVIRSGQDNNASGTKEILEYKIRIDDVGTDSASKISKKQTVIDSVTGKTLGTVKSVDSSAHSYRNYTQTDDGDIEAVVDESGHYYIELTIRSNAVYNDVEGYTVQGERIAIGKVFNIRLPNFEATGICVDLNDVVGNSN